MSNPVLEYFQKLGEERGMERGIALGEELVARYKDEAAKAMLADKIDSLDIIRYTGIDIERLKQLREDVLRRAL